MQHPVRFVAYTIIILCLLLCIGSCSTQWTAIQWNEKGRQYYTNGDYDSAIFAFLKSIAIDPIVASVWNNLGVTYETKKMQNESSMAFKRARELSGGCDPGCCNSRYVYHMVT